MIQRQIDAEFINSIINDPSVRPDVADIREGTLDLTAKVNDQNNYMLAGQYGGILFQKLLVGIYECHTVVLPEGRGRWATELARICVGFMFTRTDCWEIMTRVPHGHDGAKMLALMQGFRCEFTREKECLWHGNVVDVDIYSLRLQSWIGNAHGLNEVGEWVHRRMLEEAKRLGITEKPHGPDPNHDRYVGAAFEMIANGQPAKGVHFYNRWALASRHKPVVLLATDPVTIRFDIGVMRLIDGDIEVERVM